MLDIEIKTERSARIPSDIAISFLGQGVDCDCFHSPRRSSSSATITITNNAVLLRKKSANAPTLRPQIRRKGNDKTKHLRTPQHLPIANAQLKTYKVGDIVDIVGNSAQQKGLPYKYYHGKTGVVFNITKSAVGVSMQKIVGNRYIEKRLHVRVEHVRHSRCRDGIPLPTLIRYGTPANSYFLGRC
jgi:ribosomal protein L21E